MSTTMAVAATNRPVKPDNCYNCGSTGSCKKWRGIEGCVQHPRPHTLKVHKELDRDAAIKAMTSAQRGSVLGLLSMMVPEQFDFAVVRMVKGES